MLVERVHGFVRLAFIWPLHRLGRGRRRIVTPGSLPASAPSTTISSSKRMAEMRRTEKRPLSRSPFCG